MRLTKLTKEKILNFSLYIFLLLLKHCYNYTIFMFKSLYRFLSKKKSTKKSTIVLDYDLDRHERLEIFQNYDLILCEKCNHKTVGYPYYYCESCYNEETGVEKNRIKYGK